MLSSSWLNTDDDGEERSHLVMAGPSPLPLSPSQPPTSAGPITTTTITRQRRGWQAFFSSLIGSRPDEGEVGDWGASDSGAVSPPPRPPPAPSPLSPSHQHQRRSSGAAPSAASPGGGGHEGGPLAERYSRAREWATRVVQWPGRDLRLRSPTTPPQHPQQEGEEGGTLHTRWGAAMTRLGIQEEGRRTTITADAFFGFDSSDGSGREEDDGVEREASRDTLSSSFLRFPSDDDDARERAALVCSSSGAGLPLAAAAGGGSRSGSVHRAPSRRRAQLASLVLLFVNFSFVVAAMTLLMAGVAAKTNSVISLCAPCRQLSTASIVFGSVLLFSSLWGFLCLRYRHLLCLLLYALVAVLLLVGVTCVIALAAVYNREARFPTTTDEDFMLRMWVKAVNDTHRERKADDGGGGGAFGRLASSPAWPWWLSFGLAAQDDEDTGGGPVERGESAICRAQREFNCSGFHFGCCRPGVCYDEGGGFGEDATPSCSSSSSASLSSSSRAGPLRPAWVRRVCPRCPATPPQSLSTRVCTGEVYTTVRRNMTAFLLLSIFAWLLMGSACLLACLARRAAVLRARRRHQHRQQRQQRHHALAGAAGGGEGHRQNH